MVGRRSWLFSNSVAGANASANLYSLLQTCVANGIDGCAYLKVRGPIEVAKANCLQGIRDEHLPRS